MLGILLIYFMAKPFYKLAEKYNRSKWGYSVLAVAVYFGLQILAGVVIAFANPDLFVSMDNNSGLELGLNVVGIIIGALGVYALFQIIKNLLINILILNLVFYISI